MSYGLKLLKAIVRCKDRNALNTVNPDYFDDEHPEELSAYKFIKKHSRLYGKMPSIATVKSNGHSLEVSAEEPVAYYMQKVIDRALFNIFSKGVQDIAAGMQAMDVTAVRNIFMETLSAAHSMSNPLEYATLGNLAKKVLARYKEDKILVGLRGIPTGWASLDASTGGWQQGDNAFIVARPYMGKSWCLLHSANAAWRAGNSVCFVSMEMLPENLVRRWIGMSSLVNPKFIAAGKMGSFGEARVSKTIEHFDNGAPVHFLSGNFEKSVGGVESMLAQFKPTIAFIDAGYLLAPSDGRRRYNSASEANTATMDDLKKMALGTGVPNVVTVQFNRTASASALSGSSTRLDLSSIGGTDAVGKNADHVLGLRKPRAPHSETARIVEQMKVREGEPLDFGMNFQFYPMNFEECPVEPLLGHAKEITTSEDAQNDFML